MDQMETFHTAHVHDSETTWIVSSEFMSYDDLIAENVDDIPSCDVVANKFYYWLKEHEGVDVEPQDLIIVRYQNPNNSKEYSFNIYRPAQFINYLKRVG